MRRERRLSLNDSGVGRTKREKFDSGVAMGEDDSTDSNQSPATTSDSSTDSSSMDVDQRQSKSKYPFQYLF